jgi:hypothetical protein
MSSTSWSTDFRTTTWFYPGHRNEPRSARSRKRLTDTVHAVGHDAPADVRRDAPVTPTGARIGVAAARDLSPADGTDVGATPDAALPPSRYDVTLPTGIGDAGRPFGGMAGPYASWPRTDHTLPIENPETLDRASAARDAQLAAHGTRWARTHTAAYDVKTGEISVRGSGRGTNNCAEPNARAGLTNTADEDVRYIKAKGWRKNPDTGEKELVEVPVCGNCQDTSEPSQYPPGTPYQPGARWDQINAVEE